MADDRNQNNQPTFAFEHVAARLITFDLMRLGISTTSGAATSIQEEQRIDRLRKIASREIDTPGGEGVARNLKKDFPNDSLSATTENQQATPRDLHPLAPIVETNGLVFPYNPTITENISVKYDAVELTHTNEAFHVYRGTDNVRLNISNAVWTCDTFDNAVYAMAALHFFRTYSQMDFGRGRTGRPPSPMWFSAYGNYAFHRVPVLLEKADWNFPNDVDYVGIPEFGSTEYRARELQLQRDSTGKYTWLPMKFEISGISLVVQHSPKFWTNWSLADYRSGAMLRRRGSFHSLPPQIEDSIFGNTGTS